jgi:MFS family permease
MAAAGGVVLIGAIALIRVPRTPRMIQSSPLEGFLAGLHYVRDQRILLTMITLDLFAVLLGGAVYLLPIYAQDILNVGAAGFGLLQTAPAWGAMFMAFSLVYLPPIQKAGRALLLSIAGFGVATIVFGLSTSFWLSFCMLALTGAFDNVSMVIRHTLQQLLTPNEMRGRVSAVTTVFISASKELGGLESGLVAHWFGPVISVVSGGIGTLIVVGATAIASPELRRFGTLADARPLGAPAAGETEAERAVPA